MVRRNFEQQHYQRGPPDKTCIVIGETERLYIWPSSLFSCISQTIHSTIPVTLLAILLESFWRVSLFHSKWSNWSVGGVSAPSKNVLVLLILRSSSHCNITFSPYLLPSTFFFSLLPPLPSFTISVIDYQSREENSYSNPGFDLRIPQIEVQCSSAWVSLSLDISQSLNFRFRNIGKREEANSISSLYVVNVKRSEWMNR